MEKMGLNAQTVNDLLNTYVGAVSQLASGELCTRERSQDIRH